MIGIPGESRIHGHLDLIITPGNHARDNDALKLEAIGGLENHLCPGSHQRGAILITDHTVNQVVWRGWKSLKPGTPPVLVELEAPDLW